MITTTTTQKHQQQRYSNNNNNESAATPLIRNNNNDNNNTSNANNKNTAGSSTTLTKEVPSYEERCRAAAELSRLTPEQRKLRPPLFVPRRLADFDDGGAYPEIHVAQYPRHMGNPHLKKQPPQQQQQQQQSKGQQHQPTAMVTAGSTSRAIVTVEIDKDGKVSYDAIVKGGTNADKIVYTKLDDMKGVQPKEDDIALPTTEQEQEETMKTQAALQALLQQKTALDKPSGSALINAATSQNIESKTQFIKYTARPEAPGYNPAAATRVIQVVPAQIDPMMPPKHKHIKAPRGPAEDPVPILQAPPRKLTKEEKEQWNIPACISNWKNTRGYTIPLDKRLAADGRGLLDKTINANQFAALSESLYIAEQQARQEVRTRALIQKKQVLQETTAREEELRQLAQQARMERNNNNNNGGTTTTNNNNNEGAFAALRDDESIDSVPRSNNDDDSDSENSTFSNNNRNNTAKKREAITSGADVVEQEEETEDDIAARQREKLRLERKRERERELRLEKNIELKKKQKFEEERDISEKIALGVHTGTGGGNDSEIDSRLYNQSAGMDSGFGADDEYNTYTQPLFGDRSSAGGPSIYRPTRGVTETEYNADEQYEKLVHGATTKFQPDKGFSGAGGKGYTTTNNNNASSSSRTAPVQFEKER